MYLLACRAGRFAIVRKTKDDIGVYASDISKTIVRGVIVFLLKKIIFRFCDGFGQNRQCSADEPRSLDLDLCLDAGDYREVIVSQRAWAG